MPMSMQAASQVDGKDLDPSNTVGKKFQTLKENPPDVGTTHRATVQSVKSYGAFVRLEGYKSNGLVHSSQVSMYESLCGFFRGRCACGYSDDLIYQANCLSKTPDLACILCSAASRPKCTGCRNLSCGPKYQLLMALYPVDQYSS